MAVSCVANTRGCSEADWIAAIPKGNSSPATIDLTELAVEFTKAMSSANGKLLAAFLKAAKGFGGLPIHYPRLHNQQGDGSEHYEWFVANEGGRKLSLPDLNADPSLPGDPVLL